MKISSLTDLKANIIPIALGLFLLIVFAILFIQILNEITYRIRQLLKKKNESGYVLTPNGNFEHREIVEKLIKRKLAYGEEVHHINGVKWDNRKSNLALMSRVQHLRWHRKLEWMWSQKYKTPLSWQHRQLVKEFEARLF